METVWKNDELTITLDKLDMAILEKARNIGNVFAALNQEQGQSLVDAVDEILTYKKAKPK